MHDRALHRLEVHAQMAQRLVDEGLARQLAQVAEAIAAALRAEGRLLLFGNGGSAADAQHIATEFTGRYLLDRPGLPALALAENTAALTAIGNDYGFEQVFARQVGAFGRPGDVAIALSTSGTSPNVLRGVEAAREAGLVTVGVTGPKGDQLAAICEHCISIPAEDTPQIQEGTMLVLHTICELVEHDLFG
ncbi:MAG: D-sedoheptulose 7-phosphate isomerase [Gaiellales bacterium]|jgi:D-sedoheptulose 7-phosphate isomerase|nr:D-sedoheptulose 7-phosphate isomerase [Gaiellales bacterium]